MRAVTAVAGKEAFEARWRALVLTAILVVTAISLPLVFEWLPRMVGDIPLPGSMLEDLESQLADPRLYLWASWYGKNYLQIMAVGALIWGMGLIARDREKGTLGYILSRSITRRGILGAKFGVAAAFLALISLVSTLILVVAWGIVMSEGIPWDILMGLPQAILSMWVVLAITSLFSAISRDQIMALVGSGAILILMVGANWFPQTRSISLITHMAAGHTLRTGELDLVVMASLLAALVILYLLTLRVLESTDL